MPVTYIDIPLKPYLKKYLEKKLGIKNETIVISFNDIMGFGMYVTESLSKKRKYYYFRSNSQFIPRFCSNIESDSRLRVGLKYYHTAYSGPMLSEEKIYYINKFVEKQFRQELFTCIQTQTRFYPNIVISIAIDDFLSLYGISDDDIQRETMYRLYHRHKRKYSMKN